MKAILGISAYYHDSAAALVIDGEVIAAAQEERFSRKKHDESFPSQAVEYVLKEACVTLDDIEAVAFYDKPYIKFERLLETYHSFAPKGLSSFWAAMPVWIKEKLFLRRALLKELAKFGTKKPKLLFPEHHLSHAASAFYPSPYSDAAVLTIDGVGEWATTTIAHGSGSSIKLIEELHFPHSVGLLYSSFTYFCGFKVNSGEYKLMGLAPYGNHSSEEVEKYKKLIKSSLVDIKADGSILLNMEYFRYPIGLTMIFEKKWHELFGLPVRKAESELSQSYMNIALAIQEVTEEIVLLLAKSALAKTQSKNLVMAGGVALNCVANGKIISSGICKNLWIQPAAGDAGGSVGAALAAWYIWHEAKAPKKDNKNDLMSSSLLGPVCSPKEIMATANRYNATYTHYSDFNKLCSVVAKKISQGKVVGWVQGRMEFGPRALGNRSILGDARNKEMQKRLNLKIKYRESFRPFAPSVLEEDKNKFFDLATSSPYMLLVAPVSVKARKPKPKNFHDFNLQEKLYHVRSAIPAVTHIDYSARVQTVSKKSNHRYWSLLKAFKRISKVGMLINTSFNVRGEPIVCTADDAYRCFMHTEMDYLVVENFLFAKSDQPPVEKQEPTQFAID